MKLKKNKVFDIKIRIPEGLGIDLTAAIIQIGPKDELTLEPIGMISLTDPSPKKKKAITAQFISAEVDTIETTTLYDQWRTFKPGLHHYEFGIWFHDGDFCNLRFSLSMPKKKKQRKYALERAIRKYLNNYTGELKFE